MHYKQSEDLIKYYNLEDSKEKKRIRKRKQSKKNKRSFNNDKQQWLDGDGPQTD